MAYSQVGIVNLSCGKIGAKSISSMDDDSEQAIKAKAAWDYVRDEVLEAAEWRFAKTRVALAQSTTTPVSGWLYAYPLPSDFLRLCRGRIDDPSVYPNVQNAAGYPTIYAGGIYLSIYDRIGYPYVVETLSTGRLCLFTNYDNSSANLYLVYIRRVVNVELYSPSFISALSFRLAAELALARVKGQQLFDRMMGMYEKALKQAEGITLSFDELVNEQGSTAWELAGRS